MSKLTIACRDGDVEAAEAAKAALAHSDASATILTQAISDNKACERRANADTGCVNYKLAKLIIDAGVNINTADEAGDTALHIACRKGCSCLIRALLDAYANIGAVDAHGKSPFYYACVGGRTVAVELMLERGAVNLSDAMLALRAASREGLSDVVKTFIPHLPKLGFGDAILAAFTHAAANGSLDVVRSFLDVDLFESRSEIVNKSFIIAAYNNQCDIMQCLLDNGASIDFATVHSETAFTTAVCNESSAAMEMLLDLMTPAEAVAQLEAVIETPTIDPVFLSLCENKRRELWWTRVLTEAERAEIAKGLTSS
jgi:uncharacterized protein